jgi:hypothetical protein
MIEHEQALIGRIRVKLQAQGEHGQDSQKKERSEVLRQDSA